MQAPNDGKNVQTFAHAKLTRKRVFGYHAKYRCEHEHKNRKHCKCKATYMVCDTVVALVYK